MHFVGIERTKVPCKAVNFFGWFCLSESSLSLWAEPTFEWRK
jgi:hypothetical protein